MAETDAVLNAETRRALRRRVRQAGMGLAGAFVAILLFGLAALTALVSVPWQLSLAVTVGVAVAVPVAVPYTMLRVFGLSQRDVIYVAKQAGREGIAEAIALRGSTTAATAFAEQETSETAGNGSLTPDGGETETETETANESAKSDTGPANPQDNG